MIIPRFLTTFSSSLLGLLLLPILAQSYDCGQLNTLDRKCPIVPGPIASYPNCLVTKLSVSAFIQCADVKGPNAPRFQAIKDGDSESVGVLDVLIDALNTVPCNYCPLAENIRKAADGRGLGDFATYLCKQFHPVDAGICCLRQCLKGVSAEHSIEAFCNGRVKDLMNAPLVPSNCVSNEVRDDPTNGGHTTSNSDTGSGNGVTGSNNQGSDSDTNSDDSSASSSDQDTLISTSVTSSANNASSTTSSTPSTTSTSVSNVAATGTTSASAPQEAQGTPNGGADSGRGATYRDQMKRLCFALLPIVAGI
ncbi:MAG: hypothetical protein L6R40_008683 [Gallowayella cf. fulva]|nr:MAG: hypothetical protein L6R40_008683 [Xanthomendoza cf. fulva]